MRKIVCEPWNLLRGSKVEQRDESAERFIVTSGLQGAGRSAHRSIHPISRWPSEQFCHEGEFSEPIVATKLTHSRFHKISSNRNPTNFWQETSKYMAIVSTAEFPLACYVVLLWHSINLKPISHGRACSRAGSGLQALWLVYICVDVTFSWSRLANHISVTSADPSADVT